jgi:phosphopantothenate--cysteine ligase
MNVLVTGGGTIAPIDDVRQITNASTGRFSAAISEACLDRGATVWHLAPATALRPFERHAPFDLGTADPRAESERLETLRRRWLSVRDRLHDVSLRPATVAHYASRLRETIQANAIDLIVLAMAVSDYEPDPIPGKISSDAPELVIRCRPTPKVIRQVRDWAPDAYIVGFKLLSGAPESELIRQAEAACLVNRADLTVANDLQTVRAGRHTIHLVRPGQVVETIGPEPALAQRLVERVFSWAGP